LLRLDHAASKTSAADGATEPGSVSWHSERGALSANPAEALERK
jgi:hypothetical protein